MSVTETQRALSLAALAFAAGVLIVAGNAGGKLRSGRHIALPAKTPVSNVILTIMQTMGVTQTSFGDSTGPVTSLLS